MALLYKCTTQGSWFRVKQYLSNNISLGPDGPVTETAFLVIRISMVPGPKQRTRRRDSKGLKIPPLAPKYSHWLVDTMSTGSHTPTCLTNFATKLVQHCNVVGAISNYCIVFQGLYCMFYRTLSRRTKQVAYRWDILRKVLCNKHLLPMRSIHQLHHIATLSGPVPPTWPIKDVSNRGILMIRIIQASQSSRP